MNWVTDPVTNNCLSSPYPVLRSGGRASPARTQTAEIVLVCTQHVVDTQKSSALEGIDVDASDHGGRSAYTWGVAGELGEVVELLRNAGAGPHEPSGELPPYRVAGGMSRPRVVDGPETRSTTASPLIFRWRNRNRRWGRGVSNWQTERAVVLEVIVKRNGKTEFVRFVQKPYDDAELDKKFIEEAEKQEFEPATLRGKPVDAVWYVFASRPVCR